MHNQLQRCHASGVLPSCSHCVGIRVAARSHSTRAKCSHALFGGWLSVATDNQAETHQHPASRWWSTSASRKMSPIALYSTFPLPLCIGRQFASSWCTRPIAWTTRRQRSALEAVLVRSQRQAHRPNPAERNGICRQHGPYQVVLCAALAAESMLQDCVHSRFQHRPARTRFLHRPAVHVSQRLAIGTPD